MRMLGVAERERLDRYSRGADADRYVSAHVLLRSVAAAYLGGEPSAVPLTFACGECGGSHGGPRLPERLAGSCKLSLSHAGDRVVVAVAHVPVGVDIEPVRALPGLSRIAEVALAPVELRRVMSAPQERRPRDLLGYWTCKEAVLKALGCGLRADPRSLVIDSAGPDGDLRVRSWPAGVGPAVVTIRPLEALGRHGYAGAVAVLTERLSSLEERDATERLSRYF
jgi:4'-phosphopantetheinyl transferase